MHFALERTSPTPLYVQLAERLAAAIRKGTLHAGHRLHSARTLASELGINRLTVEAAFGQLERQGLVERRQGSGSYVLPGCGPAKEGEAPAEGWPAWQLALGAEPVFSKPRQAPRHDFATGSGDSRLIPATDMRRELLAAVRRDGTSALGYEDPRGHAPLRRAVAELLSSQGMPATPGQVLITSGAQQALSLAVSALLKPGDTVLVEDACYDLALRLFAALGLRIRAVPCDRNGILPHALGGMLSAPGRKLLYCIPNYQNPTGRLLAPARRQMIVDLAAAHDTPILEDDYVGELRYDDCSAPALRSLDRRGGVLYTSTFSKMLVPGMRLGFLLAEGPVMERLATWKRLVDLSCPSLTQRALASYLSVGRYRSHLRKARGVYRKRRDAMVECLHLHFPPQTRFDIPRGGFFLWLKLPHGLRATDLLPLALEKGLSFAPGPRFAVEGGPDLHCWLRLNFAAHELPDIEQGMRLLGRLITDACKRRSSRSAGSPRKNHRLHG